MQSIGWIGLGYMGSRIATRLLKAGFPLVVYNRDRAKADSLVSMGATVAASPAELAERSQVIFSCLSDGLAIRKIYFGADGVLRRVEPETRIVEMSTVAPETSRHLFHAARERGASVVDLAISGSTPAAEAGSLTLFGGGERSDFDAVASFFPAIAMRWFYMGPSGSGMAMKLVVNDLLGVGMQTVAEALALGSAMGLDRDLLFQTLARTAVIAPAHVGKLAAAEHNDYRPQFPLRLMRKDFHLILSKAKQLGLELPATHAAAETNAREAARGDERDFSAVIRLMEESIAKEEEANPAA